MSDLSADRIAALELDLAESQRWLRDAWAEMAQQRNGRLCEVERERDAAQATLSQAVQQHKEALAWAEHQRGVWEAAAGRAGQSIREVEADMRALRKTLTETETRNRRLCRDLAEKEGRILDLEAVRAALQGDVEAWKANYAARKGRILALERENREKTLEQVEKAGRIRELEEERDALRREREEIHASATEIVAERLRAALEAGERSAHQGGAQPPQGSAPTLWEAEDRDEEGRITKYAIRADGTYWTTSPGWYSWEQWPIGRDHPAVAALAKRLTAEPGTGQRRSLILEGIARVEARLARIEDAMAGWSPS